MQISKTLMPLLASLCLLSATTLVHAADEPLPPGNPSPHERCQADPDKCREMKEHMQTWCKDHPQRCEEMKKRHQKMREECKKDPQTCEQKRKEMREKFHQRMEEKCKQDPKKCEEWKQHHEHGTAPGAEAPAATP